MLKAQLQVVKFESNIGEQRLGISADRLRIILNRSREATHATASDFSSWVFRSDHPSAFASERTGTASLLQVARRKVSNVLDRLADGTAGEWQLVSCDTGSVTDKVYTSPVLKLNGEPLRLKPDVVYQHAKSGLVAIFEYKIPSLGVSVPNNGWPNLACQLWAYSWASPWLNDPNVLLVGVAFDHIAGDLVVRTPIPRSVKTDKSLNSTCVRLFRAWGGEIDLSNVRDPSLRKILSARA